MTGPARLRCTTASGVVVTQGVLFRGGRLTPQQACTALWDRIRAIARARVGPMLPIGSRGAG